MHDYTPVTIDRRRAGAFLLALTVACTAEVGGQGTGLPGAGSAGAGAVGMAGASGVAADCTEPNPARAPLRRLTRFEYNNTVRDLQLDPNAPADALPGEEVGNGFGNDADALSVSPLLIEGYRTVARQIAEGVTQTDAAIAALSPCDVAALGAAQCGQQFVARFVGRAFRRPPSSTELAAFDAVFSNGLQQGGSYQAGVSDVIEAVLQSPQFLYRVELGEASANPGLMRPTDYEMASRLSYLLWGSTPDAALLEAAQSAQLRTKEQIASQAQRLLADPRVRDVVRFFHGQWLGVRGLDNLTRNEQYYPTFKPGMGTLFRRETELFVESALFEGAGNLQALFDADYTFVNGPLAQFYGIAGVSGDDFRKVSLDTSRRLGFLTHASVLAATTPGSRTDPVVRGKWVFSRILCGVVPDPPPGVAELPEVTPGVSVRERLAQHRDVAPCKACHVDMDPLGFAFEHYDGAGLWRDMDNGVPVDASAEIYKTDAKGAFYGAVELSRKLAASRDAGTCYVGRWLTYAYGRQETEMDACTRSQLEQAFEAAGGNVQQLLVALTQTDAFLYRPSASATPGAMP